MLISKLLRPESAIVPLRATTVESAISALVDILPGLEKPLDREALKAALLAREAAGSTGIGNGVAIPHARSARLAGPVLSAGVAPSAIDFRAADGEPVMLVFLLAVPSSDASSHLKFLAALSKIALDARLLRRLRKAGSGGELHSLLVKASV